MRFELLVRGTLRPDGPRRAYVGVHLAYMADIPPNLILGAVAGRRSIGFPRRVSERKANETPSKPTGSAHKARPALPALRHPTHSPP